MQNSLLTVSVSTTSICSGQREVIIDGKHKQAKALLRPILQLTGRRSRQAVQLDARVSIGIRRSIHAEIRSFGSSSRCVTVTPAYIARIVQMQNDGVSVF